jgi:hypothetical protein
LLHYSKEGQNNKSIDGQIQGVIETSAANSGQSAPGGGGVHLAIHGPHALHVPATHTGGSVVALSPILPCTPDATVRDMQVWKPGNRSSIINTLLFITAPKMAEI